MFEFVTTRPHFEGPIPNPELKALHDAVDTQWASFVHGLTMAIPLESVPFNRELLVERGENLIERNWDLFWSIPILTTDVEWSCHDYLNHGLNNAIFLRIRVIEDQDGSILQYQSDVGVAGKYPPDGSWHHTSVWRKLEIAIKDQQLPLPNFCSNKTMASLILRSRQIISYQALLNNLDLP